MSQSRLAVILADKSPAHVKKVLELRELHSCLMELPHQKILELQSKAVYVNYIAVEGRILTGTPRHYLRNGIDVETYFKYIDRVH